ncbi:hypothetical protein [Streptacidiphilus sp. P02-A3a]|uniref:hypothetical protein n=1 Tax=Streptacidiphilus sp. P02-A3a TaxID=2704468 RepID=UPI0015FCE109|nr:hypothetical protein [Streptacidiphilus sp. P02-A3a]QMU70484.1 hypothetical protein GXP74_22040 [Streptacidiphilus sp. P02-A3a]
MSTSRRVVLSAAVAAPLLAQFTGARTASASTASADWGTVSSGWVEVRWTAQAQAQLDRFGAVIEAVAPAELVRDAEGSALRFPVRSGTGDPSLGNLPQAQGDGTLDGGVAVRTADGVFQVTDLHSALQDSVASGTCTVNGVEVGHQAVAHCGLAEGLLTADGVRLGQPVQVQLSEVPLRATPQLLAAYTATFGEPAFNTDTVLAYVTAQGLYTPPKA